MAYNDLEWRKDSKKCIIVISDANAHGKRFCGIDNHNEEEDKLVDITKTLAKENFYFIGINVIKNDDGCKKTLEVMRKIYEENNGKSFVWDEFKPAYDKDEEIYMEDYWTTDIIDDFKNTMNRTGTGIFEIL